MRSIVLYYLVMVKNLSWAQEEYAVGAAHKFTKQLLKFSLERLRSDAQVYRRCGWMISVGLFIFPSGKTHVKQFVFFVWLVSSDHLMMYVLIYYGLMPIRPDSIPREVNETPA